MKYENLIYAATALIILTAGIMNILNIPFGNTLFVAGVLAMLVFQQYHLKKLRKRIKELEDKDHS